LSTPEWFVLQPPRSYDPRSHSRLSFSAARRAFLEGTDTPRAFLERCIELIETDERDVKAFVTTNIPGARTAADASVTRYEAGRPRSVVDGLPIAIKDLFETQDLPTQMNSRLFSDWHTGRDSAHVYVLRRAGALVVGKTVTTEFAMATPGPTRNPFDTTRTPGGSSSGTSAAVGAGMVPVGTGSQVRGSIIRPAGYCANYALKPTFGALNQQGGHGLAAPSQCVLGVHAATLTDCWEAAFFISSSAGGDPGYPGLYGEPTLGPAKKIDRLIRLDTLGWEGTEPQTRDEFERFIRGVEALGVEVLSRRDDERIEALERSMASIPDFMFPIFRWEMRWPGWVFRERGAHLMAPSVVERLARADEMSIEDYRRALEQRAGLCRAFAAAAELADAFVTLCSQGPAPVGMPVGDPVFSDISSNTLSPAMALPLLAVDGLPLGVQLVGMPHQDFRLAQQARWLAETYLGSQPRPHQAPTRGVRDPSPADASAQ
jgi:Asp-tRNA(Asn)/Glu-tRNA(Gln) amidotransferase A subunit family amidase